MDSSALGRKISTWGNILGRILLQSTCPASAFKSGRLVSNDTFTPCFSAFSNSFNSSSPSFSYRDFMVVGYPKCNQSKFSRISSDKSSATNCWDAPLLWIVLLSLPGMANAILTVDLHPSSRFTLASAPSFSIRRRTTSPIMSSPILLIRTGSAPRCCRASPIFPTSPPRYSFTPEASVSFPSAIMSSASVCSPSTGKISRTREPATPTRIFSPCFTLLHLQPIGLPQTDSDSAGK